MLKNKNLNKKLEVVKTKTKNAMNIFTKTVSDLEAFNNDLDDIITESDVTIDKVQTTKDSAITQKLQNDKVIAKIKDFIN